MSLDYILLQGLSHSPYPHVLALRPETDQDSEFAEAPGHAHDLQAIVLPHSSEAQPIDISSRPAVMR